MCVCVSAAAATLFSLVSDHTHRAGKRTSRAACKKKKKKERQAPRDQGQTDRQRGGALRGERAHTREREREEKWDVEDRESGEHQIPTQQLHLEILLMTAAVWDETQTIKQARRTGRVSWPKEASISTYDG